MLMSKEKNSKTCCIIGCKKIVATDATVRAVKLIAETLITDKVKKFVFVGDSELNELCRGILNELKEKYPDVELSESSCHSPAVIDSSDYCIFYYDEGRDFGTKLKKRSFVDLPDADTTACYLYAKYRDKVIFNVFLSGRIDLFLKNNRKRVR